MKTNRTHWLTASALLALAAFNLQPSTAHAQGTAFTYQGRLNDGPNPASGNYDLRFALYDAMTNGTQQGSLLTNSATAVSNGLFTVTLDFGNQFPGAPRWLEIGVSSNGVAVFSTLAPRQPLTPVPYAIFANTASNLTGMISTVQLPAAVVTNNATGLTLAGTFTGNGAGITNINAALLGGISSAGFWKTNGNTGANPTNGAYLGTADNLPLEFRVNGLRAMRYEFGGVSSVALGMGYPSSNGAPNLIGGAPGNFVSAGVVGAVIGGGGATNYGNGPIINSVGADFGTVGGGFANQIQTTYARTATIAGGDHNLITSAGAFIGGGGWNGTAFSGNSIASEAGTIAGGYGNQIQSGAMYSTIGGGDDNLVNSGSTAGTITGGTGNHIQPNSVDCSIGGGFGNQIMTNAGSCAIGGGNANLILSTASAQTTAATIGGGRNNLVSAGSSYTTISGGYNNHFLATNQYAFIGGGNGNSIQSSDDSCIGGGANNSIVNTGNAFVGGGINNQIQQALFGVVIVGGSFNQVQTNSPYSTIGGGMNNIIKTGSMYSIISGGTLNTNTGPLSMIAGGDQNVAAAKSFAAGHRAKALDAGAFVWADATDTNFLSSGSNSFNVRASGGVVFTDGAGQSVTWLPGAGSWSFTSDRNAKENFAPVDAQTTLEKVSQLRLLEWSYKGFSERHVGPMAQDFHAAFPFNPNSKLLNSADETGVALAAIQGLNEKLETQLKTKDLEIQDLKTRLDRLEQLVSNSNAK